MLKDSKHLKKTKRVSLAEESSEVKRSALKLFCLNTETYFKEIKKPLNFLCDRMFCPIRCIQRVGGRWVVRKLHVDLREMDVDKQEARSSQGSAGWQLPLGRERH